MSLTFVPTPLGNLRDITLRALDVLRTCDLIVAEDTRVTRKLLSALDLPGKEIWSYREQNAATATASILERAAMQAVAVVSDAGMPGISDPGCALVVAARVAGIALEVLPGPSAFVCAAVLSGMDLENLHFAGFIPRSRSEREGALAAALASGATTAFYESPHRIVATLEALGGLDPDAHAFVARELTKVHEQHIDGTPAAVLATLQRPVRGEIVLVIAARAAHASRSKNADESTIDAAIDSELALGASVADVARTLANRELGDRRTIYRRVLQRKTNARTGEKTSE